MDLLYTGRFQTIWLRDSETKSNFATGNVVQILSFLLRSAKIRNWGDANAVPASKPPQNTCVALLGSEMVRFG